MQNTEALSRCFIFVISSFFFFSLAHEWCNLLVRSMHVWIGGGEDCDIEGVFGLEIGESSHAVAFHRTET